MGCIVLTEAQEANFLKVIEGLRIHKANGTTHLRNSEEAFTCVVDDAIEMVEKALTIPMVEIGGRLFVRGGVG
ncbi:MAG: hypothetical protein WCI90_07805 [Chlorobium sp.]|nr:MAG: hypothetical protein FDX17_00755 [Chlorobium sp.]